MPEWEPLFESTVPVLEGFVRGTVTFLAVLLLLRVVGQREPGGLGITDVLLVVLVAEAAAPGLHGDATSLTDGIVVVATILGWSVAVDALAYRSPWLGRILKASPRPLIEHVVLNRRVMRREFMTDDEVMSQLRLHGIDNIGVVERAYIEPNGMISTMRNDDKEVSSPERPPSVL